MQRHEIIKPFSDSSAVRLMQTATRQPLLRTTRRLFTALALLTFGGAAQAEELGNFKWSAVVDANERVVIGGIQYAPEFAPEPWSISRASDSAADVTRFEVRAGDQWGEDRSSGENKER